MLSIVRPLFDGRRHWLYLTIAILAALDLSTTLLAKQVLGSKFLELGLIAGQLMKVFNSYWPVFMFASEFSLFAAVTFLLRRSSWNKSTMSMFGWKKMPVGYLPIITLLSLIGNNLGVIIGFYLSHLLH